MKKVILFMSSIVLMVSMFLGSSKDFDIYDRLVRGKCEVIEQGIKIQYVDNKMDKSYLKNVFSLTDDFEMYNENFYYLKETGKFSIEIKGIDNFIEVEIKDFTNVMKIEELERLMKKEFNNKKDLKTFTYVKGKVNDNHSLTDISKVIRTELKNKENESLKINNGETGMIKLRNSKEYNYSLVSYGKDDNYIIVGSPVIFIAY